MLAAIPFPPLSPELFAIDIFGFHLALRWYALAYIAGILLGWRFAVMTVNRAALWRDNQPPMTRDQIEDLLTWIILGVIIGGRLGYVLFYQPGYYLANPTEIPIIWQGGMSFHGGFLGTVIGAWIFCARHNIPKLPTADMLALAAPAGLFFGRIANFINAELWGRQTDVPWGVIFPGDHAQNCGQPLGEFCARHPSQLYEAGLEGLALGLIIFVLIRRGALKTPGLIAGTFFAGYGAARFFVEFFRQPDAQFQSPGNPLGLAWHINGYGLTMGQILTLPMIAVGIWFILRAKRAAK
ncbi:prolipoprotein diacylglyceryl transferase [uncultured Pelagimonas sp.]|uniref:prolipoprotein diacylglyceryl transferase n=1 Tax=uncultured Pelagimonas sp. TaxID=1618102 RepID=UPI002608F777|nr:prolipoprotein diacylglyceryl transferase [uncultured Pelagimonas sp.]